MATWQQVRFITCLEFFIFDGKVGLAMVYPLKPTLAQVLTYHFETVKGALYGLTQFLITESPLKMMRNAFYFTWKALFVLKIFTFLSWLFGHVDKTARLERSGSKSMTSQPV